MAWVTGMLGLAVLHQAVLVEVGAVAVGAGEGVAVRHRAEEAEKETGSGY